MSEKSGLPSDFEEFDVSDKVSIPKANSHDDDELFGSFVSDSDEGPTGKKESKPQKKNSESSGNEAASSSAEHKSKSESDDSSGNSEEESGLSSKESISSKKLESSKKSGSSESSGISKPSVSGKESGASESDKKPSTSQIRPKTTEEIISLAPDIPPEIPVNPEQTVEIERLQAIVREQRTVIDNQKETIRRLMSENGTHEEIASLRAALACKSPLLQRMASIPTYEQRAIKQLKADNAALRREIEETEVKYLNELKRLRSQLASLSARPLPVDGCARCKRRVRELENERAQLLNELEIVAQVNG
jgi:hypothetical protein